MDRTEPDRFGPTRKGSDYIHSSNSQIGVGDSKYYCKAAHRRLVNVLTSNSAFFIFAVLVV